jgi:hypothetical protein
VVQNQLLISSPSKITIHTMLISSNTINAAPAIFHTSQIAVRQVSHSLVNSSAFAFQFLLRLSSLLKAVLSCRLISLDTSNALASSPLSFRLVSSSPAKLSAFVFQSLRSLSKSVF